ncbi:MAG: UDP-N-acetylglucosamine 2-epimerase (non-hydrolyzing) [Nitrospirae bacterium]|nr:UDP-N-acetylglucosamine 2-epimerase (non-hydrolyzing) [Nitrospirota bacterium]MBI3805598.1 UDP-N-acetylglucosamine 2-epimerase (non-hydrolyzing) [Candidatus Manganitrophaceae bacterium]
MKIINIVGARPNFMKIAPLIREMKKREKIEHLLVHTGQHYDNDMSDSFFKQLEIPEPDINLGVGAGSHAEQTAKIMIEFEKVLLQHKPDFILVVGDVNSTIACSLVASKLGVKIIHVEAGLRSFDRGMPEEINRVLTDAISDLLFTTEASANKNLKQEGVPEQKVFFVGNVMIDTLVHCLDKIQDRSLPFQNLHEKQYAVVTLHRPSNVDRPEVLEKILDALSRISQKIKLVIPLHPRTQKNINAFGLQEKLDAIARNGVIAGPIGYLEMLRLIKSARLAITDSGGLQEETTYLGVPCITMRENTERPSTVELGTNVLVGNDLGLLFEHFEKILSDHFKKGQIPPLWDGKAASRIVEVLVG